MKRVQRRVAVIDDDESVRESLPDLLRQFGYTVMAFDSAEQFLTFGQRPEFDCLILDIAMPGMSGPELHRELTTRGETLPVIFITGHADTDVRSTLRKEGAVDVLIKPFSAEDLLSALKVALPPG